jgi:NADH-quinone oxidoreductase subunit N
MNVIQLMFPEVVLVAAAAVLFLLGVVPTASARRVTPWVALLALIVALVSAWYSAPVDTAADSAGGIRLYFFSYYVKVLSAAIGIFFVLLSWPVNRDATGNSALDFDADAGEYFALLLLSITGLLIVAGANDIIILFLGIELASIPTYIMVSVSRPLATAQEAGVKYFFLGTMAAALMLFGFSYLYGTTGLTTLDGMSLMVRDAIGQNGGLAGLTYWQELAVLMLIGGFSFKMTAVPLHSYAADVYQGAATPVTALLSFVPKTSGFVALVKVLFAMGGGPAIGPAAHAFVLPPSVVTLIWVLAVMTMTVGNVLGLLQSNVKRVLAYSSIAHSGYMLVAVATMLAASDNRAVQIEALQGLMFYLGAYGIMNTAAFGVLMLLPARPRIEPNPPIVETIPAAETFDDLAGTGRDHPGLGLAMAIGCFSLIGLPMTVGFWGKFYLIRPALRGGDNWLVIVTMVNAAISAAYYLRIVAAMFLRPSPSLEPAGGMESVDPNMSASQVITNLPAPRSIPVLTAVILSAGGAILFGTLPAATNYLTNAAASARFEKPQTPPAMADSENAMRALPAPPMGTP